MEKKIEDYYKMDCHCKNCDENFNDFCIPAGKTVKEALREKHCPNCHCLSTLILYKEHWQGKDRVVCPEVQALEDYENHERFKGMTGGFLSF